MKKNILAAGLAVTLSLVCTGCGVDNYTLTTEENDRVAQYIASAMLEHSYDNEWQYRKAKSGLSSYKNTQSSGTTSTGTSTSGSSSSTGSSSNTVSTSSTSVSGSGSTVSADPLAALSQTMGLSNVAISYSTYVVDDRYPTGEYAICVPADTGYKVVAVEFDFKNSSNAAVTLNSKDSNIVMKLSVDGDTIAETTTLLKNDISQLKDVSVAAGETYTAVAVFQVKEDAASQISKLSVSISANGSTLGTVTIQ